MHKAYRMAWAAVAVLLLSAVSSAARLDDQTVPKGTSPLGGGPDANSLSDPALPPSVTVDSREVEGVLGKQVRSIADENMGRIVEVVVDRAGQVRAAVIDFGGFLGVGSRKIAVDWNLLQFDTVGDPQGRLTLLKLTPDQVWAAPEYKPGKAVVIVSALGDAASWQPPSSARLER